MLLTKYIFVLKQRNRVICNTEKQKEEKSLQEAIWNNKSKVYTATHCSLKTELAESPQKQTYFLSVPDWIDNKTGFGLPSGSTNVIEVRTVTFCGLLSHYGKPMNPILTRISYHFIQSYSNTQDQWQYIGG